MSGLVLSLFPGIGLLDQAFEEAGFCVVRGPDVLWGGDIRRFHPPAGKFDGVIGGPPCQAFSSLSRLVKANGHEPKFGNLIPEYERVVAAARPAWFLMENVPAAPIPIVDGYGVKAFLLDNSRLADEGGIFGQEQRRVRRFSFGLDGRNDDDVPSLMRWIDLAVWVLPDASVAVTSTDGGLRPSERRRVNAVLGASSANEGCLGARKETKQRRKAVSSSNGGNGGGEFGRITAGAGNGGKGRYRLPDACRLQGLPEDFLADAPFTAEGKLKAVANGVPLPMGRAIAAAVKEAIGG